MSGFGSLYYTDCVPGQGIQGVAGFQFQAATPGAEGAMALVQRSALYEPPAGWMRDRRPVGDYPRSLSHIADGDLFATAAGCYLGKEANGPREGNQFTHAVVTRDAADYGLVRPAQLWDADWWVSAPASGTELEAMPDEPAPGPLDPEAVRDRVKAAPNGQERLTALLSAIQHRADAERRRTVVLVTTDPGEAACWIAAATLLLPGPQALRTSFKIFTADAQYGGHDVVALHPDWAGRWADTSPGSGLSVFDLDRGRHSEVEPTAAAAFWVPRFLRTDVYDVIDAVELSGQFARARTGASDIAEPTDADRLAAVVVAGSEGLSTDAEIDSMATWLLEAPAEAFDIAGEDVLAAVLAAQPRAEVLRTLAEATGSRGWVTPTARILRGLLPIEIREVLAVPDGVAALRAVTGWRKLRLLERPAEDRERGRTAVEEVLRTAQPYQVPAVLAVAERYGLRVFTNNVRDAMDAFTAWWLLQTAPELELGRWPAPPDAIDWVRDMLRLWLRNRPGDAADAIHRWWQPLRPDATDPRDPLDAAVLRAAYDGSPSADRGRVLRDVQRHAASREPRGSDASVLAWDVLYRTRVPATAEAAGFVTAWRESGRPISHQVLARVAQALERETVASDETLRMLDVMREEGFQPPARLAQVQARDDDVLRVIHELKATSPPPDGVIRLAHALNEADVAMLESRAVDLVDALVAAPAGVETVRECTPQAARAIYQELESRWPSSSGQPSDRACSAATFSFVLADGNAHDAEQRRHFDQHLRKLADSIAPADKNVRRAIERLLPKPCLERWEQWLVEIEPRRMKRALNFVAKAVPGRSSGKSADEPPGEPPERSRGKSKGTTSGKRGE